MVITRSQSGGEHLVHEEAPRSPSATATTSLPARGTNSDEYLRRGGGRRPPAEHHTPRPADDDERGEVGTGRRPTSSPLSRGADFPAPHTSAAAAGARSPSEARRPATVRGAAASVSTAVARGTPTRSSTDNEVGAATATARTYNAGRAAAASESGQLAATRTRAVGRMTAAEERGASSSTRTTAATDRHGAPTAMGPADAAAAAAVSSHAATNVRSTAARTTSTAAAAATINIPIRSESIHSPYTNIGASTSEEDNIYRRRVNALRRVAEETEACINESLNRHDTWETIDAYEGDILNEAQRRIATERELLETSHMAGTRPSHLAAGNVQVHPTELRSKQADNMKQQYQSTATDTHRRYEDAYVDRQVPEAADTHRRTIRGRRSNNTHSSRSKKSVATAMARLQLEMEEKLAAIKRKELQLETEYRKKELEIESDLIRKRCAAEAVALEEDSEEDERSDKIEEKVNAWLQSVPPVVSDTIRGESSTQNADYIQSRVGKSVYIENEQQREMEDERIPTVTRRVRIHEEEPIRVQTKSPTISRSRELEIGDIAKAMNIAFKGRPTRQSTDLPTFSGSPSEWLQFKNSMIETTALYNYTPLENVNRLRNSLKGEAKEIVAPLMDISAHPDIIMESLEQTFGRPELLVDKTMEDLQRLPKLGGTAAELNTFAVKVKHMITVLKNVKEGYLQNPNLIREILEKLNPYQKSRWYEYAENEMNDRKEPEIVILSEFLTREAKRALKYGFITKKESSSRAAGRVTETKKKKPVFTVTTEERKKETQTVEREYKPKCADCEQSHAIATCPKFQRRDVQDRWEVIKSATLCFKCLKPKHRMINCRAKNCGVSGCKRSHHRLLHAERSIKRDDPYGPKETSNESPNNIVNETVSTAATVGNSEVKLKICPVIVSGPKGEAHIHALFDEGSTITLLDKDIAESIGVEGPSTTLAMKGINTNRCESDSRIVSLRISGINGPPHQITARTVKNLKLSSQSIPAKLLQLNHLKELDQRELCYENAIPEMLIGSDNWQLIVTRELKLGGRHQPAASRTELGWVIHGTVPLKMIKKDEENILHVATIEQHEDKLEELIRQHYEVDDIGISTKVKLRNDEQRAVDTFNETVRKKDSYYEVGLPWKTNEVKLPMSYNAAVKRLKNLEQRLEKHPDEKKQYHEQIQNLMNKGYAEKCKGSEMNSAKTWFLPHFAVRNKPGKTRVVFDAAAKSNGVSLNDFLLEGPDLLKSLPTILYHFREEPIAVTADIQDMFLRIKVREEDQPAQLFVWRNNRDETITSYKMTSMIFGAKSSPYLAHSVRNRNAEEFRQSLPKAYRAITEAHYMDDYVDSYPTKEEAIEIINQVDYVHQQAGFHLRKWNTNDPKILDKIDPERWAMQQTQSLVKEEYYEKTLGLLWDATNDVLKFNTSMHKIPEEVRNFNRPPTKREALSAVMSIYDPLGLLSCYTISSKIMLQNLWRQKLEWDEAVPSGAADEFEAWMRGLEDIGHLQLPRNYNGRRPIKRKELHVLCDASEDAYAAVAYWRMEYENNDTEVVLAAAKAKVAPLKGLTIPRMELQAALIGARLGEHISKEHRWKNEGITFWTDSQTVIHWIRNGSRRYTPYVAHRLSEINELSSVHQWRWLPTQLNTADLATRAGYIPKGAEDPWFAGPEFLRDTPKNWPQNMPSCEEPIEQMILHTLSTESCLPDIKRISSYEKLIRTTAMLYLFTEKCKNKSVKLDVEHLQKAENQWFKKVQDDQFHNDIVQLKKGKKIYGSSPLYRLNPFYDGELLRLKGRINAANVSEQTKGPIILDGRHPFTRLLIAREHERGAHTNRERTVNDLRQKFWITKLRPAVRSVVTNCALCKIRRAQPKRPPMGDLPKERFGAFLRPFSNCGVDYFGPITVTIGRRHEKRWCALFTCLTTRAVHLELVASLSTSSAIMAMRRMAARRGWPAVMYSDNATNFKGADIELKKAYEEWTPELRELGLQYRMKWKYIAPGAPSQGGAWERLVRTVKAALTTTLNEKSPKEEVLLTLLAEAEHTVNARPLTHVSVDHRDPEALTPNHFLIGSSTGLPHIGPVEETDRRMWRAAQALANEFWRRWVHEYLPTLVPRRDRTTTERDLAKGDVVIVVDPDMPRNTWPRGIIEATYPGPDGRVRNAEVRTRGGVFRRPAAKLALLQPVDEIPEVADSKLGEKEQGKPESPAVNPDGCVMTSPGGGCC